MLSNLYVRLGLLAGLLAALAGVYFYWSHLTHQIETLKTDNISLTASVKSAEDKAMEDDRREKVADQITNVYNVKRESNEKLYQEKVNEIDIDVQQGQDRPVGPLLNGFFNRVHHNESPDLP